MNPIYIQPLNNLIHRNSIIFETTLHRLPRSFPLPKYPYCSEYVLFVNYVVIVCLFTFLRLDDNESKKNGSQSQPRNGDGDYTRRDEDEDYYDMAQLGKPSFESYPIPIFQIAYFLVFKLNCMIELLE
jgi:hypothetical protein